MVYDAARQQVDLHLESATSEAKHKFAAISAGPTLSPLMRIYDYNYDYSEDNPSKHARWMEGPLGPAGLIKTYSQHLRRNRLIFLAPDGNGYTFDQLSASAPAEPPAGELSFEQQKDAAETLLANMGLSSEKLIVDNDEKLIALNLWGHGDTLKPRVSGIIRRINPPGSFVDQPL